MPDKKYSEVYMKKQFFKKWHWGMFLLLFTSLVLAACGGGSADLAVGDAAPDFTLPTSKGTTVSLSDFTNSGKPALLYFHMAVG